MYLPDLSPREGEGVAVRALKNLEVDLERTCAGILKDLDPPAPCS
jgi:hypothetical protein